jgi:hypothetical protein
VAPQSRSDELLVQAAVLHNTVPSCWTAMVTLGIAGGGVAGKIGYVTVTGVYAAEPGR